MLPGRAERKGKERKGKERKGKERRKGQQPAEVEG